MRRVRWVLWDGEEESVLFSVEDRSVYLFDIKQR